jgi:hypothetical protein
MVRSLKPNASDGKVFGYCSKKIVEQELPGILP